MFVRLRPMFCRLRPTLGDFRQHLPGFGQLLNMPVEFGPFFWPHWGDFGPIDFDQFLPGRVQPMAISVLFGPTRFGPTLGDAGRTRLRFRPHLARTRTHFSDLGQMWRGFGQMVAIPSGVGHISTRKVGSAKHPFTCSEAPDVSAVQSREN